MDRNFQMIPRTVYFNKDGIAIGAGFSACEQEAAYSRGMHLPTDHYDFLGPVKVKGKTESEIMAEANKLMAEKV